MHSALVVGPDYPLPENWIERRDAHAGAKKLNRGETILDGARWSRERDGGEILVWADRPSATIDKVERGARAIARSAGAERVAIALMPSVAVVQSRFQDGDALISRLDDMLVPALSDSVPVNRKS